MLEARKLKIEFSKLVDEVPTEELATIFTSGEEQLKKKEKNGEYFLGYALVDNREIIISHIFLIRSGVLIKFDFFLKKKHSILKQRNYWYLNVNVLIRLDTPYLN
jgi:hypothetical protein